MVVKIIDNYLERKIVKQQRGYSDALRLKYDNDVKYYLGQGCSNDKALHADTIISFWTIYKTLLKREVGWNSYRTPKSLESLLQQIRSKLNNAYIANIIQLNEKLEDFANVIYTKGNYMLLPDGKRAMNNERYEDRIDLTLFYSFSGGKLSHYFENDELLRGWIIRERLEHLFVNNDIKKDNIIWLLNNEKKITDMKSSEIYVYIDAVMFFIKKRSM